MPQVKAHPLTKWLKQVGQQRQCRSHGKAWQSQHSLTRSHTLGGQQLHQHAVQPEVAQMIVTVKGTGYWCIAKGLALLAGALSALAGYCEYGYCDFCRQSYSARISLLDCMHFSSCNLIVGKG